MLERVLKKNLKNEQRSQFLITKHNSKEKRKR